MLIGGAATFLKTILSNDNESTLENHPALNGNGEGSSGTGWDEEAIDRPVAEGYCVECEG